jgi:hypothetical protein
MKMTSQLIKEIAEKAGFILWENEDWNPGDVIDWSTRYDDELAKFAELIVRECAEVTGCNGHVSGYALGDLIKEHFGIKK